MPVIRFTDEELNELSTISTDLNNYVEEMKAKWITGASDIEKDWEDYKSRLKEMNVERYVQIYQEGYERYK